MGSGGKSMRAWEKKYPTGRAIYSRRAAKPVGYDQVKYK